MIDATARGTHRSLRIVYFGASESIASTLVLQELLRAVRSVGGARVVAICDTAQREPRSRWQTAAYAVGTTLLKRVFDADRRPILHPALTTNVTSIARRHRIPVLVPQGRDVNHPDFVAQLRDGVDANTAIVVGCLQIFRSPLLSVFDDTVNLHSGSLPRYRGISATGWSIYRGDARSGFSYHRMVAGIDEGPVLRHGDVPIANPPDAAWIDYDKSRAAAAQIGAVLGDLVAGAPGRAQEGESSYFGRADLAAIRIVEAPERLTYAELDRRLRAFRSLWLSVGGSLREVTKLERATGHRRADFVASDGVPLAATRIGFIPPALHRLLERTRLGRPDPHGPASPTRRSVPLP